MRYVFMCVCTCVWHTCNIRTHTHSHTKGFKMSFTGRPSPPFIHPIPMSSAHVTRQTFINTTYNHRNANRRMSRPEAQTTRAHTHTRTRIQTVAVIRALVPPGPGSSHAYLFNVPNIYQCVSVLLWSLCSSYIIWRLGFHSSSARDPDCKQICAR